MAASSNLNFRRATAEDAVKLEALINTAFRDDKTTQVFLDPNHPRNSVNVTDVPTIQAKIVQPDCEVLVATDADGVIVGHCSVRKLEDGGAWLGLLAVDVKHKNRGLGSQVLRYAEDYARRENGAPRMEFDVVCTRSDLIAWYGHRGYEPTGKTSPFPYDRHGDWEGILRDDLYFINLSKSLVKVK